MSNLVKVVFDGDTIEVIQEGDRAFVVLKRVSEILGVDPDGQRRKVRSLAWANAKIISAFDAAGRNFDIFCLDIDSFHGWLFTINPGKVAAELQPKLIRYQRECARVLRDHFFGAPMAPLSAMTEDSIAKAFARQFVPLLTSMQGQMKELGNRLQRLESGGAVISEAESRRLRSEMLSIAHTMVRAKVCRTTGSAHRTIQNRLGARVGWLGKGCRWNALPLVKLPDAMLELGALKGDAEKAYSRELASKQADLFGAPHDKDTH